MIDTFMTRIFVICDIISRPLSREGTIYWELWIRSQQPVSRKQNNPVNSNRSRPSESSSVPKGYCFKFHKGGDCLGCAFTHSCPKCEGAHRMSVCTLRGQSKQTTRTIAVMSKKFPFSYIVIGHVSQCRLQTFQQLFSNHKLLTPNLQMN